MHPVLYTEDKEPEKIKRYTYQYARLPILYNIHIMVKIYSIEYFYNTKVPGLGEIFVQRKIFSYTVNTVG